MDREQLAARHTDVIRRHSRALADTGGQPGAALLEELAAIADEYAADLATVDVVELLPGYVEVDPVTAAKVTGEPAAPIQAKPATARKPAARRTTTRRSPK